MATENTVCLSIAAYNQIKAENTRFHMFIDRMMESSALSQNKSAIEFDSGLLSEVIHLIYPEQYKKRLSYLRSQDTKDIMRKAQRHQDENNIDKK